MTHLSETEILLDILIAHWLFWEQHENYYLTELAPSLLSDPSKGDPLEQETFAKLRKILTQDKWQAIPSLLVERRAGILREIESERLRREMQEREKEEVKRIAAQKAAQNREEEARERLRQEQIRKQAEERRTSILLELRRRFNSDFLSATPYFFETCADILTEQEFESEKFSFVKSWTKANTPIKNSRQELPDDEQIAAISAVHGHIQVVARAGSGKTTTLVNRTLFLLKHCRIAPAEILILTFNRKAAREVSKKLLLLIDQNSESVLEAEINRRSKDTSQNQRLNSDEIEEGAVEAVASQLKVTLPAIMTFHALSLIHI